MIALSAFLFFFFMSRRLPRSTLFPYTTLFRSVTSSISMNVATAPSIRSSIVRYGRARSEEHTSELQSQFHLVCRLLLEKKNHTPIHHVTSTDASHIRADLGRFTTKPLHHRSIN